jgi:hypothetical protein
MFLNYVESTWMPHKERFVDAWTQQHLHLGNSATSRVEGAHSRLNSYLQVLTGDLLTVFKAFGKPGMLNIVRYQASGYCDSDSLGVGARLKSRDQTQEARDNAE